MQTFLKSDADSTKIIGLYTVYETHSRGKGLPLDAASADPEGEDPAGDPPVHEGVPRED